MRRLLILLPMLLVFASLGARAEDRLDVTWREAKIIPLPKPATSVIIGDPTVADVTLDDPNTLVVFGKAPGETNIIVLSGSREMMMSMPLLVSPSNSRKVTVLNASADPSPVEVLYSCGQERCTRVLSPSDISFSASSNSSTSASSDATKSGGTEPSLPGSFLVVPQGGAAPAAPAISPPSTN